MSKYTTEVRYIVESKTSQFPNLSISDRIDKASPEIFNFTYPIFSEDYRLELQRKILMHYYTREIGFETVALWQLFLNERMNLIMPYYNELYKTLQEKYDIFETVNVKETHDREQNTLNDRINNVQSTNILDGNVTNQNALNSNTNNNRDITTKSSNTSNSNSVQEIDNDTNVTSNETRTGNNTSEETQIGNNTSKLDGSQTVNENTLNSDLPQMLINNPNVYGTGKIDKNGNTVTNNTTTDKINQTTDRTDTTNQTNNKTDTTNSSSLTKQLDNVENSDTSTTKDSFNETKTDTQELSQLTKNITSDTQITNENQKSNTDENLTILRRGKDSGLSYTQLLTEYRESLINVDRQLINELSDLFMNIY